MRGEIKMKLLAACLGLSVHFALIPSAGLATERLFNLAPQTNTGYELSTIPRLLINTTGEGVELSLELPNIQNFIERSALPSTTATALKAQLEAGSDLFQFNPSAECQLISAQAESSYLNLAASSLNTTPYALDVNWAFSCAKPAALQALKIALFSHFPQGFEQLAIEWVTEVSEGQLETSLDTVIKFN